mgnify:CR=1 FL=1
MTIINEEINLEESYLTHVLNPISNKKYPVYKNPSIRDIRDLSGETNAVAFVSHDKNLYVFHGGLLHKDVIPQLKLPIPNHKDPDPKVAFLGRAKPNSNGTLSFSGSNQQIKDPNLIQKHHSHLSQWFK